MRDLAADQLEIVSHRETMPVYLVEINLSGQERLSTSGDRTVGDEVYAGGDVGVRGLDNWAAAQIRLRATPERVAQVLAPGWRGADCRIWLLPYYEYPRLIEDGYYDDGLAMSGPYTAAPILLLDGVLTGAAVGDAVELSVAHRAAVARWVPGIRIAAPLCNHLPRPGTVFTWAGDNYTLEAR